MSWMFNHWQQNLQQRDTVNLLFSKRKRKRTKHKKKLRLSQRQDFGEEQALEFPGPFDESCLGTAKRMMSVGTWQIVESWKTQQQGTTKSFRIQHHYITYRRTGHNSKDFSTKAKHILLSCVSRINIAFVQANSTSCFPSNPAHFLPPPPLPPWFSLRLSNLIQIVVSTFPTCSQRVLLSCLLFCHSL